MLQLQFFAQLRHSPPSTAAMTQHATTEPHYRGGGIQDRSTYHGHNLLRGLKPIESTRGTLKQRFLGSPNLVNLTG